MKTSLSKNLRIQSRKIIRLAFLILTFPALINIAFGQTNLCSRDFIETEVLATPTNTSNATVHVNCNIVLQPQDVVKKRILFEGAEDSGLTLDCNGATTGDRATIDGGKGRFGWKDVIEVKSREENGTWNRPANITVRDCNIIGSIRVWGRCPNSDCASLKDSSSKQGHTRRMRASAPRNIVFDNITLTGTGRNPLYFGPGVTGSKLLNSEIKGKSTKVGIYLDAESARNVIDGNTIHVSTGGGSWYRDSEPLIAVDGSSSNRIINNFFSKTNHGGIYLYRNCGYKGVSRHATPSRNLIINNIFYYNRYRGSNRAIHVGAHDGYDYRSFPIWGTCHDDKKNSVGSGVSDRDHARHNAVMQNQFYKRPQKDVIQIGRGGNPLIKTDIAAWGVTNKFHLPVYIDHNETVTDATVNKTRRAGCFLESSQTFMQHGEIRSNVSNVGGRLCSRQDRCDNSYLQRGATTDCRDITEVAFDCRVEGDNNGCETVATCPGNDRIIASKAVCNLEFGSVSQSLVNNLNSNLISVSTPSDKISKGSCHVGSNKTSKDKIGIQFVNGLRSVAVGCKEHDRNGGDCHIKGSLYCR